MPDDARREVQDIFDRVPALYAVNLRVVRKYPYGWWWSLDRPGDTARATRILLINFMLFWSLFVGALLLANCLHTEQIEITEAFDPDRPDNPGQEVWRTVRRGGVLGTGSSAIEVNRGNKRFPPGWSVRTRMTFARAFGAPVEGWTAQLWICAYVMFVYATLHTVGVFTQLSRSLPAIGRLRRSVVNASFASSGKLVWQALLLVLLVAVETGHRLWADPPTTVTGRYPPRWILGLAICTIVITVFPWIGLLRSDPTRTLVQSRIHALRIFGLYVVALPPVLLLLIAVLVEHVR